MDNPLYKERLSSSEKAEIYGNMAVMLFSVGVIGLGWYLILKFSLREQSLSPADIRGIILGAVLSPIFLWWIYRRTLRRSLLSRPIEIYKEVIKIPTSCGWKTLPKEDIKSIFLINWSLPSSLVKYHIAKYPKGGIKGIGIKLKDGRLYKGPARDPAQLGRLLEEIKNHWGEQYIEGELSRKL